jgi:hypothetical protein
VGWRGYGTLFPFSTHGPNVSNFSLQVRLFSQLSVLPMRARSRIRSRSAIGTKEYSRAWGNALAHATISAAALKMMVWTVPPSESVQEAMAPPISM